jgi:hypothetical protein
MKHSITHVGQKYVDSPVYTKPDPLKGSVARAFGRNVPAINTGTERVQLRWMKPDGKGGLVPKQTP